MMEGIPIPKCLSTKLSNSGLLFLGYSLADWNLRVLLTSLRSRRRNFLVKHKFTDFQLQLLQKRNLTGIKIDLADLVAGLQAASP